MKIKDEIDILRIYKQGKYKFVGILVSSDKELEFAVDIFYKQLPMAMAHTNKKRRKGHLVALFPDSPNKYIFYDIKSRYVLADSHRDINTDMLIELRDLLKIKKISEKEWKEWQDKRYLLR